MILSFLTPSNAPGHGKYRMNNTFNSYLRGGASVQRRYNAAYNEN